MTPPRELTVDLELGGEDAPELIESGIESGMEAMQQQLDDLLGDLQRLAVANARNERMLAEFRTVIDTLLQILRVRESLDSGHLTMIDKLRRHVKLASEPQLALGTTEDKYAIEPSDIDCASLIHLCHGRCCSFNIPLSQQDLTEGKVAWRIRQPYLLAQRPSGTCVYQDEDTGGCGNYQYRPAPCRTYDCRQDTRVWIDYEARIAAPTPDGLVTIRRKGATGAT